jgi:apolipoprotein D and lipocalin family protein
MHPRGFVVDRATNSVWGMQFVWPIKADYRIAYLSGDYDQTVVAREARDYVWIMARSPSIGDADYRRLTDFVAAMGYDTAKLRKVPQRWPSTSSSGGTP